MATWADVCVAAAAAGGSPLYEATLRRFDRPMSNGATHPVWVSRELLVAQLDFVQVKSPIIPIGETDLADFIRGYAGMVVGAVGYQPNVEKYGNQSDGSLFVSMSLPIPLLDLSGENSNLFQVYLGLVAEAAYEVGSQIGSTILSQQPS